MSRVSVGIGFLGTAVLLLPSAGCNSPTLAKPQADSTGSAFGQVATVHPVHKPIERQTVQPGRIDAYEQTPLYAKLAAYVAKTEVDIGDRVQADQVLAQLAIPELDEEFRQKQAAVAHAEAGIDQAAATVQTAEAASRTAESRIREAEAGKIRADADVRRWQAEYDRIKQLVAAGSVDRKLVEEVQESLRAAEASGVEVAARVESAKATLAESLANVAKAKTDEALARAQLQVAHTDLAHTKAMLEYTQIRAPFAGVVTQRNVDRGHFVERAGPDVKPLFVVARTDLVRIFVDVPETEAPWIAPGNAASIRVQALGDQGLDGRVTRTSWSLNVNRTLRAEIDLENREGLLRPGMYATARISLLQSSNSLVVPASAVVRASDQTFCWTVEHGKLERTPVVLGLRSGDEIGILSGLSGKDSIVVSPTDFLQDGQRIAVASTRSP